MKRKGITPVIAVVLLLLITVGAVASAWGLYQQITSNQQQVDQLNARQAAANTEISTQSVYQSDEAGNGFIMASLRNTGSEPVNLSRDVELLIAPGADSDYYGPGLYDRGGVNADVANSNCFSTGGSDNVLGTGETIDDCNTTVPYPSAGETYKFRLSYRNVDGYSWDFSCSPSSATDIRCD